jgi:thiamine monophosphate synthase
MAWTQTDLDALETAIKAGVRSVQYRDRSETYHSLTEMLQLRDAMKQTISTAAGTTRSTYGSFSKD